MLDNPHTQTTQSQPDRLAAVFPNADVQVVSALSSLPQTLTRYLSQIHELTRYETAEAIEVFFDFRPSIVQQSDAA